MGDNKGEVIMIDFGKTVHRLRCKSKRKYETKKKNRKIKIDGKKEVMKTLPRWRKINTKLTLHYNT